AVAQDDAVAGHAHVGGAAVPARGRLGVGPRGAACVPARTPTAAARTRRCTAGAAGSCGRRAFAGPARGVTGTELTPRARRQARAAVLGGGQLVFGQAGPAGTGHERAGEGHGGQGSATQGPAGSEAVNRTASS